MPSRRVLFCASALVAPLLVLSRCSLDGLSGGPVRDAGDASVDAIADGITDAAPFDAPFVGKGDGSHDCSVHANGKLYCQNSPYTDLHGKPSRSSPIVDHLNSIDSAFDCWGMGELHDGGNTTWYRAVGDEHLLPGWAAARDLGTSSGFDMNPSARGFAVCP